MQEISLHQTASSANQSDMFSYILEKRWNRRVGRDSRASVDRENAIDRGWAQKSLKILCSRFWHVHLRTGVLGKKAWRKQLRPR